MRTETQSCQLDIVNCNRQATTHPTPSNCPPTPSTLTPTGSSENDPVTDTNQRKKQGTSDRRDNYR